MDARSVPVVETARLFLRGPGESDADVWAQFLSGGGDWMKYVPSLPDYRSPQDRAQRLIARYLARWNEQPPAMGWAVGLKPDGQLIGFCGVDALSEAEGEIEYFVAPPYWHRGYAGEAAAASMHYWFQKTSGDRMLAYVVPENVGSVRVIQRLGFQYRREVDYVELAGIPNLVFDNPLVAEYALGRGDYLRLHADRHVEG